MLATEYEEFSIRKKKKKLVPPQTRIRLDRWKDDDESRGEKEEWMEGDERSAAVLACVGCFVSGVSVDPA